MSVDRSYLFKVALSRTAHIKPFTVLYWRHYVPNDTWLLYIM